jgi:ABC-type nitrate/sulfonate/bicarbonate transport system permease component
VPGRAAPAVASGERGALGSAEAARGRVRPALLRRGRPLIGVAAALGLWALLTQTGLLSHDEFPTIQAVVAALGDSWGLLLSSLGSTLESLLIGLALASAAGAVLGVAAGISTWADAATDVIVRMARPLPSLALIPIAILLAGLGTTMTAGLVAFAAFWPVFINARYATRQVDPLLLDTGRALGFGRWQLIWRVVVPSVAPATATGIRVAAGLATVVTISVELVAGTGGLGGYVMRAQEGGATAMMYAGIVVGGLMGWLLSAGIGALSGQVLRWDAAVAGRAVPP